MSNEAEGCPFCGKERAAIDTFNYVGGKPYRYRVQCQECGANTRWYETEEQAWEAWNTRPAAKSGNERLNKAERLKLCSECLKKKSKNLLAKVKGKA
jgi:Lar family restriction alleviation protein